MPGILIHDYSADILDILALVFKKENFKVRTCCSAGELFTQLRAEIPDILIVDVGHTALAEETMCKFIKSKDKYKGIPLLITTTNPFHAKHFLNFNANDAIEKPFDLPELMQKVNGLLLRSQSSAY